MRRAVTLHTGRASIIPDGSALLGTRGDARRGARHESLRIASDIHTGGRTVTPAPPDRQRRVRSVRAYIALHRRDATCERPPCAVGPHRRVISENLMPTIDIQRTHNLGRDKARAAAELVAARLKEKIDATYRWDGDDLRFERSGAKGRIHVTDTTVRLEIDLGLVLRPLKGKIEEKAHQYLDEHLRA